MPRTGGAARHAARGTRHTRGCITVSHKVAARAGTLFEVSGSRLISCHSSRNQCGERTSAAPAASDNEARPCAGDGAGCRRPGCCRPRCCCCATVSLHARTLSQYSNLLPRRTAFKTHVSASAVPRWCRAAVTCTHGAHFTTVFNLLVQRLSPVEKLPSRPRAPPRWPARRECYSTLLVLVVVLQSCSTCFQALLAHDDCRR